MHEALAVETVTVYSLDEDQIPHVQVLHKAAHLKENSFPCSTCVLLEFSLFMVRRHIHIRDTTPG